MFSGQVMYISVVYARYIAPVWYCSPLYYCMEFPSFLRRMYVERYALLACEVTCSLLHHGTIARIAPNDAIHAVVNLFDQIIYFSI